jgi:site-specific DNA-methyltransferase (adenine-specific)
MKKEVIGNATLYLGDCMDLMKQFPDKHFDLAIVDPPYGLGIFRSKNHIRGHLANARNYKPFYGGDKKSPDRAYFIELQRVSKYQIIWGANHFISKLAIDSPCWIVWDKQNGAFSSADCELAWSNFKRAVRIFTFRWHGMLQGDMKNKEARIHPTQKPVTLYKWLLSKYAKQGWKILDTHFGSGSIAVACNELGFNLTASEIDEDYFNAACKRIQRAVSECLWQW